MIGPRGFSAAQTAYWENVLERVAGSDEWKEELEQNIAEGTFMKSAATRKFFESEFTTARRVLGELGLAK